MKKAESKLLSILIVLCMVLVLLPTTALAAEAQFTDMPNNYSTAALQAAVKNGLLKGSGGKLMPTASLTRAELATIVNHAFGATVKGVTSGYTDVPADAWYANEMAVAVHMKTLVGDGNKLNPNAPVTRQEAFTALAAVLNMPKGSDTVLAKYKDNAKVASWARSRVAAMVTAGYACGDGVNLNPTACITRADFAVVMNSIVKTYITKAGTYTENITGNVMVNASGVVLKNITITGDLIIGDGVGSGDITLDGVTVTGRTIVRGGGIHSVKIINKSNVGTLTITKVDGEVRVATDASSSVDVVVINDGKDDVIVEGSVDKLEVAAAGVPVTVQGGTVGEVSVTANNARVTVAPTATVTTLTATGAQPTLTVQGTVTTLTAAKTATGASVNVVKGAKVGTVNAAAAGTAVTGEGSVTNANVTGNNVNVATSGTSVTVAAGATGAKSGDTELSSGTTTTTTTTGGTSPSGGVSPVTSIIVTTDKELQSALVNSQYSTIVIGNDIAGNPVVNRSVMINGNGKTLTGTLTVNNADATVTIDNLNLTGANTATGYDIKNAKSVTLENGSIAGFNIAAYVGIKTNSNTTDFCMTNVNVSACTAKGVYGETFGNVTIKNCTFSNTGTISGTDVVARSGSAIDINQCCAGNAIAITNNTFTGIGSDGGATSGAIKIKARDIKVEQAAGKATDFVAGSTYHGSFTSINVNGNTFNGCTRDIVIGTGNVPETGVDDTNIQKNCNVVYNCGEAEIGTTYYGTLAKAIEGAVTGNTVALIRDADISTTGLTVSKILTIDLNGHKLKVANTDAGQIKVDTTGDLTLVDSTDTNKNGNGNGMIYSESTYGAGGTTTLTNITGKFTMDSGYIKAVAAADPVNEGEFGIGVYGTGSVTINGGKIEAGWYAVTGNGAKTTDSTVIINGGTLISTNDYAIYNPQSGKLEINGGTIYGNAGGIAMNAGTLKITSGIVTSKGEGNTGTWGDGTGNLGNAAINLNAKYGDVTATISGGTVTAEGDVVVVADGTAHTTKLNITGGSFSSDPSKYVPDGYEATENGTAWTVAQKTAEG